MVQALIVILGKSKLINMRVLIICAVAIDQFIKSSNYTKSALIATGSYIVNSLD